ncbi:MAG: FAD-dependent monooxygenase [Deltaproteobacteria bacterium]|nr:FAD-dependent monooxygenase [Deltaproteobacteria bacterium]
MTDSDCATAAGGDHTAVLVVGAGPTGLLLAAELRRHGVACRLIDARPAPQHWDRATVVHPRSLELFESLGVVERFLAAGTPQRAVQVHSGGQLLGVMDLASCGSVYGYNLGLSEEVTESILTEYLRRQGGDVQRDARLVGFAAHAGGVRAEIARDGRREVVAAEWMVGCDGLHSPTRELSGIGFDGHDIGRPWAVFDATLQGWSARYDVTFAYLDALPVILTALPGRRWRVYLRPSTPQSDLVADAAATLRRYAPQVSFTAVENPTRFHCHTRVATRFRAGRVLLAGDAAHLCSPAEGHGMNCGLQDAFNLAWKLALVCRGAADACLLDSYEAERRPAAELVMRSGDAVEAAQALTDPAARAARDRTMRATLADPAARHHEVVAEAELNVSYGGSPIVCGAADGPLGAGQRLPDTIDVRLPSGATERLHRLAHRAGHTVLLLGRDPAVLRAAWAALPARAAASPLFAAAFAFAATAGEADGIGQLAPAAAARLGVADLCLVAVRPDGYIGARADRDPLGALERYRGLVASARSAA